LLVQALAALPSDSTSSLRRPSSPPALPRTSLAAGPPRPNLQLSSSALPCGAALGISSRQPSGPASNQSHDWPSQTRPTTLIACCRSVALPSDRLAPLLQPCLNQASTCVWAQPVKPQPTTFHRQFDSPAAVLAKLAPDSHGLAFRVALRPSLRLRPQAEFPLQACALRLRPTLRPPSGLHSIPTRTLRPAPSSPAAFQPALWSALSGVRLSPRALNFEPTLWQCHPAEPRLLARTLRSVSLVSAQPLGSSLRLAPSIQPLGIGPEACSATPCACLAACASCSGQLPPA